MPVCGNYVFVIQTAEGGPLPPSVFDNSEAIDELEAMYDEMTDEDFTRKVIVRFFGVRDNCSFL